MFLFNLNFVVYGFVVTSSLYLICSVKLQKSLQYAEMCAHHRGRRVYRLCVRVDRGSDLDTMVEWAPLNGLCPRQRARSANYLL